MNCIFTQQAEQDLESIADDMALEDRASALDFILEIKEHCEDISIFPEAYLLAPEYGERIRKAPFRQYSVLYTVKDNSLFIVHIIHAQRDFSAAIAQGLVDVSEG